MTPVVLVVYAIAAQKPISRGEIGGTVVAMLGGTMLVFDSKQDKAARRHSHSPSKPLPFSAAAANERG